MNKLVALAFDPKIVPPLNKLYAADRWERARLAKSAKYALGYAIREQLGLEYTVIEEPVRVTICAYYLRPRDVDSPAKCILDALVDMQVIANDDYKHVPELELRVRKCKKGQERIVVVIEVIEPMPENHSPA